MIPGTAKGARDDFDLRRDAPLDPDIRSHDARLVELVMALSGCPARRALELVRREPEGSPLDRVAYALAAMRHDIAPTSRPR